MTNRRNVVVLSVLSCVLAASAAQSQSLSYPPAPKAEIVDEYFGTRVADPYRWMEELDSQELEQWQAAQMRLTSTCLDKLPLREHFRRRLAELWDYRRTTLPLVENGQLFYRSNSGLERQSPLYVRSKPRGRPPT